MSRHDRRVIYPQPDADGIRQSGPCANPAPHSLADVIALVHIKIRGRGACRVALTFAGNECQRLTAIVNGPTVYRETEIPGYRLASTTVDALVAWAETARRARSRCGLTDAAVDVTADQRLADAIDRYGPRVVLRLLLYRAYLGRFAVPMDPGNAGRPIDSTAAA